MAPWHGGIPADRPLAARVERARPDPACRRRAAGAAPAPSPIPAGILKRDPAPRGTVNPVPPARRLVVIGASAGGVEALTRLVARLPRRLPAPVAVVLHVSPHGS